MSRSFRFVPPEPGPQLLARPRLLRSLGGRWDHRVTSVTGGPGLGKTTLLAQALAENRMAQRGDDVWVGVEVQDADADRLSGVVATALAQRSGAAGPSGVGLGGGTGMGVTSIVDPHAVADAVWHRSPSEACLVLDDVHLLPAGSTGAAWLAELVAALPANGHVVLSSRSEPAVPLTRYGSQGAVLRLAEDDLRFSDDELAGFATKRGLDPGQLGETGGWPAMAELAASVDRRFRGNYLWEEVLEPMGTLRRHVLGVLCDLGGADDELISAAVGTPVDLAQMLAGVPLIARGSDGWHVPHGLWREAPGIALDAPERASIRRRAAEHLTRRGRYDEAFILVQEAELSDAAPGVLRAACLASDRLTSGQLRRWLATSSDAVRASSPGLLAAGLLAAFTTPTEATEPLEKAVAQTRAEGDIDAEVAALGQLGRLAWWRQDMAALMELGARITELETTGHPTAQALAIFARAMLSDVAGDDEAVLAALASIEPGVLDPAWEVLASGLYSYVRIDAGDTDATHEIVERLAGVADPVLRAFLAALQLGALWADGHVEEVLDGILQIEPAIRATGVRYLWYFGVSGAALAMSHAGQVSTARRYLSEAAVEAPPGVAGMPVRSAVCTASVQLAEGDEDAAAATLRAAVEAYGLDGGLGRHMWRQNLGLSYVLVPETRPHWDAADLRGHLWTARELAQVLVALREETGADRLRSLDLPDLGVVRTSVHFRFAAELAVHLADVGRSEGRALLDGLGSAGRTAVRELMADQPRRTRAAKALLATVPSPPPRATYLGMLGPMVVRRDGHDGEEIVDPDLRRQRLQELVAFLVGHRRTTRSAVAAALWPDLDERSAANNLGVTLNHLLRVLEPWRGAGEPSYLLRAEGQSLRLVAGEHLRIDVDEFEHHLAAAAQADADGVPSVALEHNAAAVALYRDDLFLDLPEADWFVLDREHYRTRFVRAAVRAGQLLLARGDVDEAESIARRALTVDQWAEDAYGILVGAALAQGDRSAAHRMLRRCLDALTDLGAAPSGTTEQLSRRLSASTPSSMS